MHDARKAWHIGDILTVVTGIIVSPPGRYCAEELEEFMADRELTPNERGALEPAFRCALLNQYPELESVPLEDPVPAELLHEWLRRRIEEFGEYLPVLRLSKEQVAEALSNNGSGGCRDGLAC